MGGPGSGRKKGSGNKSTKIKIGPQVKNAVTMGQASYNASKMKTGGYTKISEGVYKKVSPTKLKQVHSNLNPKSKLVFIPPTKK